MIVFARADQRIPDHGQPPAAHTWDYATRLSKEGGTAWACQSGEDLSPLHVLPWAHH